MNMSCIFKQSISGLSFELFIIEEIHYGTYGKVRDFKSTFNLLGLKSNSIRLRVEGPRFHKVITRKTHPSLPFYNKIFVRVIIFLPSQ